MSGENEREHLYNEKKEICRCKCKKSRIRNENYKQYTYLFTQTAREYLQQPRHHTEIGGLEKKIKSSDKMRQIYLEFEHTDKTLYLDQMEQLKDKKKDSHSKIDVTQ